jgi:hypothetical protein
MSTTELPVSVEKDDTAQPFSKNFDRFGNSSGFIFDVSLSTAVAAEGKTEERAPKPKGPLSPEMLDKMNRYWRAANYLCIGQIYLFDNPIGPTRGSNSNIPTPHCPRSHTSAWSSC